MFQKTLKKSAGFSLFCLFVLTSCGSEEKQSGESVFYDTHQFISGQIEALEKINPEVKRHNQLQEQDEQMTLSDVDWAEELDLFLTSDINKVSYLPSYTVLKTDAVSMEYILKEGESLPVKRMKIQLNPDNNLPEKLEIELYRKNKLFDMEKNLVLHAGEVNGRWLIADYRISGYQEVLFLGKNTFDISGIVQY